jgi:hypothetical protein
MSELRPRSNAASRVIERRRMIGLNVTENDFPVGANRGHLRRVGATNRRPGRSSVAARAARRDRRHRARNARVRDDCHHAQVGRSPAEERAANRRRVRAPGLIQVLTCPLMAHAAQEPR